MPALIAFTATAFTDITPLNPGADAFLLWTPGEIGLSGLLAGIGLACASHIDLQVARKRLGKARESEQKRRAIAAIGVAASWDLDLDRLYQRISQDLRTILEFDRFTITSALPTGRMRIEFVSGETEHGLPSKSLLPHSPEEPDGLHPEFRSQYRSRLTAAIPACNGTLTIRCRGTGRYTSTDLDLLRQAVAQISPGIANAILFQASERRVKERTVLADIGRAVTSANGHHAIFEAVDSSLTRLIEYDHLGVVLVEGSESRNSNGRIVYWSNEHRADQQVGDRVWLDPGMSHGEVARGTGAIPLGGISTEQESGDNTAWLQAPLVVQEKLIGMITLSSHNAESLGQEEAALLLSVSLQIAPAIQNAVLAASLKRQADERRTIAAIGLAANEELKLDAIYNRVADELAQVIPFDRLSITYVDSAAETQEIAFVRGIEIEGFKVGDSVPAPGTKDREVRNQNRDWETVSPGMKALKEFGQLKSRTSAPLGSDPNILGSLNIASVKAGAYDQQTTEFIERVAIQITPAIRNARLFAAERELRETLDRQNHELYEANNARKQFLSTVSHELKTPLTIISGFVDLLGSPDAGKDIEQDAETLGIIRRNADQLDVLINDILDISRLDAGTFKINHSPFSANELVSDLQASFQSLLRRKAQSLRVEMAEDEIWINADRARISQVITNLLSNASKYSPEETEVTLRCNVDHDRLHIAVADQGVGITEEEQQDLFTAFFRVDNETTRKVPGTGLGLVIAKSITELHGGEIRLESRPGEGTTIEFWLPGLTTEESAGAKTTEQAEITGSRLWPDGPPAELELGAD